MTELKGFRASQSPPGTVARVEAGTAGMDLSPELPETGEGEGAEGGELRRPGLSARHQQVATLLTQLASTARSFLMYDARNAAIQRFITTLLDSFVSTLKREGQLELDVQPFELRFEDQAVYVNEDRERSLAFRLYRDGVRSLKFRDGFDWEELAKLLEIFSIRYTGVHQQEDDIVTLLWKANFKQLDVVAVEGFVPEDTEVVEEAGGSDEIESALPDDFDLPMPAPRQPSEPSWVDIAGATRDALREEVSAIELPGDCLLLLRRLRPLLDDPRERATLTEIAHLYGEIRDFLLSDDSLAALAGLIDILRDLAEAPPPEWDEGRRTVARELLRSCADERAVRRLLHSVPLEERAPRPELLQILDHACEDPLGAVAAAHAAEAGTGSRAVARQLLARYSAGKVDVLRRRFEKARGHVAVDLFQVITQVGGDSEALFSAHQACHPDAEVRSEALRALEAMPYSGPMGRALFEAFGRVSGDERARVLALMTRSEDRRFVEHLVDYLQREAPRLPAEEAAEIGRALGRLGGARALGSWQAWLKPAGLLRKGLHGPLALQVAAATALGEIPGEGAAQTLRSALVAAGPEAGRWIGQVLAHRGHGAAREAAR